MIADTSGMHLRGMPRLPQTKRTFAFLRQSAESCAKRADRNARRCYCDGVSRRSVLVCYTQPDVCP